MSTTFKSLTVLKNEKESVKKQLGDKYETIVAPYIKMIEMTMKSNDEDMFAAMKRIKEKLPFYKKPDAPLLFTAALVEIVEKKHFAGFAE